MEMQQVRYFIAVAKTLNFTRAAEECNVTQPALTRAIKLLELELGGDLIRREGRHTHLTELGNKMLPILTQCHEAALTAKLLAKSVTKGEASTLSITVASDTDLAMVLPHLRELSAAFAGTQIILRRIKASEIGEMLKSGEVDIAIAGPVGEGWDRLDAWPMFSEPFNLIVNSDHPLASIERDDIDIGQIRNKTIVMLSGLSLTATERKGFEEAGFNLSRAHEVDSVDDMKAFLDAGLGIAVAPAHVSANRGAVQISLSHLNLERLVSVYAVSGRSRTREAAALLGLLRMTDWGQAAFAPLQPKQIAAFN
jgi:DNA-binding transcriptional LysR family regulator